MERKTGIQSILITDHNMLEQLKQLMSPTWDGNLISKSRRLELVSMGYAYRTSTGFNIISPEGVDVLFELSIITK